MLRYAITIFLSAFLLFLVQPLIGKYILPWFGGGPGVWTTCMLFFQMLLLGGYAYAHFSIRWLTPRKQMMVHCVLLLSALAFLPIVPNVSWKPGDSGDPTARILLLLASCIGAPYLVLSATGPLLQAWFTRTHPGASPYRLYALSNIGSLLALGCYPFVLEPAATRNMQALIWSSGFLLFAVLCAYCAVRARKDELAGDQQPVVKRVAKSAKQLVPQAHEESFANESQYDWIMWILLPACASVMLLAVTNQMGEEIAPVPFLWVLPLAVYLLSFIVAFEWPRLYYRPVFIVGVIASPWVTWRLMSTEYASLLAQLSAYLFVLFACCMVCHGEAFRLRPRPQRLTGYYLAIAAGGALGGLFVSIIAPMIFSSFFEFYVGMYGLMVLLLVCLFRDRSSVFGGGKNRQGWLVLIAIMLVAGLLLRIEDSKLGKYIALRSRNFYGVLSLIVQDNTLTDVVLRKLHHGRTSHGAQLFSESRPGLRLRPISYFGPNSGAGLVLQHFPQTQQRRVGIVGLGVGTLAAYGNKGDVYRFYEINPQVEYFANEYFTYLQDARDRNTKVDIVMGDARLSMEREGPQQYDVIILDAFSGDAIPVHLLTKEAFEIYQKHLVEGGVIAVHVSNRYLELYPVVHRIANEINFRMLFMLSQGSEDNFEPQSLWVLVTQNEHVLELPQIKNAGLIPTGAPKVRLWTDDDSSLFEILR